MALAGATHRFRKNVHFHRSQRSIGSGYGGCAEEGVRGDFRRIGVGTGAYRVTVGELDRQRLSAIRLELKRAAVDGDDVAAYARRRRLRAGGAASNDTQAKEKQEQRANVIHGYSSGWAGPGLMTSAAASSRPHWPTSAERAPLCQPPIAPPS